MTEIAGEVIRHGVVLEIAAGVVLGGVCLGVLYCVLFVVVHAATSGS